MQSTKDRVIAALRMARERVNKGWLQGAAEDTLGNVCAAQALGLSYPLVVNDIEEFHMRHAVNTRVGMLAGAMFGQAITELFPDFEEALDIPTWNDMKSRTRDEVLHTFDHAIKLAERDM